MPIRPENVHRYPQDWREIRERILERAGHCCENCGIGNHWIGYRLPDGVFVLTGLNERLANVWPNPIALNSAPREAKVIEIVLTIAHLDHTPENCAAENLRAWCQRCHLAYDAEHHAQTAYIHRREGRALADLFDDAQ